MTFPFDPRTDKGLSRFTEAASGLTDEDTDEGFDVSMEDRTVPGDGLDLSMEDRTVPGDDKVSATVITPTEVRPDVLGPSTDLEVIEPAPWAGDLPGAGGGMTTDVSGGMLEGASEWWEEHKNKVYIGGGVLAALLVLFKLRK